MLTSIFRPGSIVIIVVAVAWLYSGHLYAQETVPDADSSQYWELRNGAIVWNVSKEKKLPHSDNIEMSGQQVSAIIQYSVDSNKKLTVNRDVIFPQLRVLLKASDPSWYQHRAYLRHTYEDDILPVIATGGIVYEPGALDSVRIDGRLQFYHQEHAGLSVQRIFLPSMQERLFVEKWLITNRTDTTILFRVGNTTKNNSGYGLTGRYFRQATSDAKDSVALEPNETYEFGVYFSAQLNDEPAVNLGADEVENARLAFLKEMKDQLVLETPDSVLNTLFYFSKIRAAESIFQSKMGLVHSPGGGRYYTGIWANDQAEYSGPFFPYLGYKNGNEAAMNAYRMFLKNIPEKGKIWASFEMQGDLPCCSKDRGDAAMIAFGATHFLLASGSKQYADELWPLIDWCLKYCEKKKTADGVIASDSDELEGRFPTGTANLSTSSLYYGALKQAAVLANAMGKNKQVARGFQQQVKQLAVTMERYFGGTVQGLETYKYYRENTTLRSWICLPLVVGMDTRRQGTLDALFTKLWTNNGVRIENKPGSMEAEVFWDRGTLYAFRGAFKAGAADLAMEKLQPFSAQRLTGFHVPYVVEAWPEGAMAHLSAESALYCRVFTEGMLGLEPSGFSSFRLKPVMPSDWDQYAIKAIKAFGSSFDVIVKRDATHLLVTVVQQNQVPQTFRIRPGREVTVRLHSAAN